MTAEIVDFKASTEDNAVMQSIINDLQEKLDSGELKDLGVVMAVRDADNGPGWQINYYGERQKASLFAGLSHMEFDMHFQHYEDVE